MLVILQGRVLSTRLPCKGFLPFFQQTVWERLCDIALDLNFEKEVIFASGDKPENIIAQKMIEAKGVKFTIGSETNVLQRFYDVVKTCNHEYFLRLTCDNYLIQPDVIESLYKEVLSEDADYGYIAPLSHFSGEIVRSTTFLDKYQSGSPSDMAKEHVTWDIRNDNSIKSIVLPNDFLGLDHENSVTLDTPQDFIYMKNLEAKYPELLKIRCIDELVAIGGHRQ
jgi:spore coat polysaccharide biosynthesis protein SpsF